MTNRLEKLFERYNERQGVLQIGSEYQPAIRAVRGEAPSMSRCCRIWFALHGRELHTLSLSETCAAIVAFFHPGLVDLLEQRCLPTDPECHPASLYPEMSGTLLPGLSGTVAIAEKLGLSKYHPRFVCEDEIGRYRVPVPFVGDLLLILKDQNGLYAVNWTVKASEAGFKESLNRRPVKRQSLQSQERAEARLRIEVECYAEAGIPTHKIIRTTFSPILVANLKQCLIWLNRQTTLDPAAQQAMVADYAVIVGTELAPLDLLETLKQKYQCSRQDCCIVFHRAVWTRKLRINLFVPVLFDTPMREETEDPLVKYAHLFERGRV